MLSHSDFIIFYSGQRFAVLGQLEFDISKLKKYYRIPIIGAFLTLLVLSGDCYFIMCHFLIFTQLNSIVTQQLLQHDHCNSGQLMQKSKSTSII